MSDTDTQVEIPAPDANATPEVESQADPSPAKADENKETVSKVQSRFDELTKHRREAERDRDYWREQALRNQTPPPKQDVAPVVNESLKTLADFEFDDAKYQAYIFDTAQKRSVEAARKELEADRDRQSNERRQASYKARELEFAKTAPDFDETIADLRRLPVPDNVAEAINLVAMESDDGPALFYHLGKNPDLTRQIAQLPPIVAARELGKIEAKLAFEREKAKEKPVSKAPAPAPKVDGTEPSVTVRTTDASGDVLSDKEWIALEKKRMNKRR